MSHNLFLKILNLKKILLILFSLLIALSVSILITTEVIKSEPENIQQSIADKFNKIKVQLEFKGLTQPVKEMTKNYSKLFDGFSNIIITDDNGKILYKVNDGYISEKNKFIVLVDPWQQPSGFDNDMAYVINSKNDIKYATELDISNNMNKLEKQSSENSLSKVLFTKMQDSDNSPVNKKITNSDGTSFVVSSNTSIIMNYEYIASKRFNLYSLYDSEHQYNNYYVLTNYLKTIRRGLIISIFVCLILFWILLAIWVFKDSRKRHLNAPMWVILTFFINIIGLGIYLILRRKNIKCHFCNKIIEDNWIVCPYCGKKINIDTTVEHK